MPTNRAGRGLPIDRRPCPVILVAFRHSHLLSDAALVVWRLLEGRIAGRWCTTRVWPRFADFTGSANCGPPIGTSAVSRGSRSAIRSSPAEAAGLSPPAVADVHTAAELSTPVDTARHDLDAGPSRRGTLRPGRSPDSPARTPTFADRGLVDHKARALGFVLGVRAPRARHPNGRVTGTITASVGPAGGWLRGRR